MRLNLTGMCLALLVVLAAGCVSPSVPATGTPVAPTPMDAPILPPGAALEAQRLLAGQLNLPPEQVKIVSVEQEEWTDGCLGLGRPDESCLLATVPGFRVDLEVDGQVYIFRTDQAGGVIREETRAGAHDPASDIQGLMRAAAAYLKVEESAIQFERMEAVEWPDPCLGYPNPAELCAQVITPGYRVVLETGGTTYEVHTDANMTRARLPGGIELPVSIP